MEGITGKGLTEHVCIIHLTADVNKIDNATYNHFPDPVISTSIMFLLED